MSKRYRRAQYRDPLIHARIFGGGPSTPEQSRRGLTDEATNKLVTQCAHGAAYVFAVNKWTWDSENPYIPGEVQIAAMLRGLIAELEPEHTMSSGRLSVEHHTEDGYDCMNVSLDLGGVMTEKKP